MGKPIPPMYVVQEIDGDRDVSYDVIIDTREDKDAAFVRRFTEVLDTLGLTWRTKKLPAGDYLLNRGYGLLIEMKSVSDFIASFTEEKEEGGSRLDKQLTALRNPDIFGDLDINRVLLIRGTIEISTRMRITDEKVLKRGKECIEKKLTQTTKCLYKDDSGDWRESGMHPNSLIGAKIKVMRAVPLVEVSSIDGAISWMISQHKKLVKIEHEMLRGEDGSIKSLRSVGSGLSPDEQARSVIEGLPHTGPKSSVKILTKWKSLRNFFTNVTTTEELIAIGISRPTAEKILRTIDYEYGSDTSEEDPPK